MPGNRPAHTLGPGNFASKIRHQLLDLAIVKDGTIGFIPDQAAECVRIVGRDQIRWDVDNLRVHADGPPDFPIDLVPGQHFIGSDMVGLTDGLFLAKESEKTLGKIAIPGQYP